MTLKELTKFGYLAGFLYGDGTCYHNPSVNRAYSVSIDQIASNTHLLKHVKRYLENFSKVHEYQFKSPDGLKTRVLVYNKNLFVQFKKLRKEPIKFFNNLDIEEKFNFLSGLLDADGTITDRIVIYASNENLLLSFRKFLDNYGVISYVYKFGSIFGLQIYRKQSIETLKEKLMSVKFRLKILKEK